PRARTREPTPTRGKRPTTESRSRRPGTSSFTTRKPDSAFSYVTTATSPSTAISSAGEPGRDRPSGNVTRQPCHRNAPNAMARARPLGLMLALVLPLRGLVVVVALSRVGSANRRPRRRLLGPRFVRWRFATLWRRDRAAPRIVLRDLRDPRARSARTCGREE